MKLLFVVIPIILSVLAKYPEVLISKGNVQDSIPTFLKGEFEDDYGIKYSVSDTLFLQWPRSRYLIIESNAKEQYLIARNGWKDSTGNDIYTRIDYMRFEKMEPSEWGYCLTAYTAKTADEARQTASADRQNPRKGCNGFPFSRMKKRK